MVDCINLEVEYKDQLDELWNKAKAAILPLVDRGYVTSRYIRKHGVVFVGLNPSYKTGDGGFFDFPEEDPKKRLAYYNAFLAIGEETNCAYSYIDVFSIRERSQNIVKGAANNGVFKQFMDEQYLLFREILRKAQPKLVVVCNAYARDWMMDRNLNSSCFDFSFDEELGTYRFVQDECLSGTPIFFSGMLTGQHAMDRESVRRLVWHIKRVLLFS